MSVKDTILDSIYTTLDGFGMISLVALTPVLSVLILSYLYEKKQKEVEKSYEDQDELTGGEY